MLSFFRNNAVPIALGIVLFFIGTMFTGIFFLKSISPEQAARPINRSQAIALIGDTPVSKQMYYNILQQFVAQAKTNNPEQIEELEMAALEEAIFTQYLLEGADKHQVKVSKEDRKLALIDVYEQFNLSGRKELKSFLALNNVPYKTFLENLDSETKVKKMRASLSAQVQVTDFDIQNFYTTVKVAHILITPPQSESPQLAIETAKVKADTVYQKIKDGLDFKEAAATYSEDPSTKDKKGLIGWIRVGEFSKDFEDAAYSLAVNEVSKPVRTPFGYHLIKVFDKQTITPSNKRDKETIRNIIYSQRLKLIKNQYAAMTRNGREIEILDAKLKAISAKQNQDYEKAALFYQSLISNTPSHPLPRYLLAKVYLKQNNIKAAKNALEKADILSDLSPELDTPYLHIELANLYFKEKNYTKAKEQWSKSISRFKNDVTALNILQSYFKSINQKSYLNKVNQALKTIKETQLKTNTEPPLKLN